MPQLRGLLEFALYVEDLEACAAWYEDLFGLEPMVAEEGFRAFALPGSQALLLFKTGVAADPLELEGGTIPGHDGFGQTHIAFAVNAADLPEWEEQLKAREIPIESRVTWPPGGESLYFRDPNGHLLELVTPGIWPIY